MNNENDGILRAPLPPDRLSESFGPRPRYWHVSGAVCAVVIIALGALVYQNSFEGPLIFDDIHSIEKNPHVKYMDFRGEQFCNPDKEHGGLLAAVWRKTTSGPFQGDLRKAVTLSLALNYYFAEKDRLNQPDTWGFHLVNLIVHILAGLALFGVVRWTLVTRRLHDCFARAATPLALAVAAIWLCHPLHTGAVTYIIQRAESAMGMFFFLTFYCAIRCYASPRWPRWLWALGAAFACLLGMWSKQVMVVAPVLVIMYDMVFITRPSMPPFRLREYLAALLKQKRRLLKAPSLALGYALIWPLRPVGKAYRKHWPIYIGLFVTWVVPIRQLIMTLGAGMTTVHMDIAMRQRQPLQYTTTQFQVVLQYIRLALWPQEQCLDYYWWHAKLDLIGFVLPMLCVLALLALTVWLLWKNPPLGFLGAWFFIILSPSSTIIPLADIAFEHRLYLPVAAVVALVVLGGYALLKRLGRWADRTPLISRACLLLGACALVGLIVGAVQIIDIEAIAASEMEIPGVVAPIRPGFSGTFGLADAGLAAALVLIAGLPLLVGAEERRWARLLSGVVFVAVAAGSLGQLTRLRNETYRTEAESWRQVIRVRPNNPRAHNNLGKALYFEIADMKKAGKHDEAAKIAPPGPHFATAIQLEKNYADPYYNFGLVTAEQLQDPETLKKFKTPEALRQFRDTTTDNAIRYYQKSTELKENFPQAYNNLAILYERLSERPNRTKAEREELLQKAQLSFRKAVKFNPSYAFAHNNLAALLNKQSMQRRGEADRLEAAGKKDQAQRLRQAAETDLRDAERALQVALRSDPYFADAHYNLGLIRRQQNRGDEAIQAWQRAIELRPDDPRAYLEIATVLQSQGKHQAALDQYVAAVKAAPENVLALTKLADVLMGYRQYAPALAHFHKAARLNNRHVPALAGMAWIMSAAPDAKLRNGKVAVDAARRACGLTGDRDARCLDILAAAYAETGQFDQAVKAADKAIGLARRAGATPFAKRVEARRQTYQAKRPHRLPPARGPAKAP